MKYFLGSVSLLALSTTALAAQPAASEQAEAPSVREQAGISEIIVTASRREENIQKAALSIQALSSESLERANVTRPEDLSAVAPGVAIGSAGTYAQAYIRGVGNFGTNSFMEGPVAFNLDGVYISRPWTVRGTFFDLDRVEVLKGPQGTLYGRNASGGAINIITTKPKLGEFGGFAEFQLGNYSLIQGAGALNLPLGPTLALRASGQVISRDGYLSDGYDDDKTQSARLQLLWEPGSDVSLLLKGQYQHLGGKGVGGALMPQLPGDKWRGNSDPAVNAIIAAEPGLGPLIIPIGTDGFVDIDIYSIGAELNWDMGFATLTALPAYREANKNDLHYSPGFPVLAAEKNKQTSLEVRLSNESDKLKWVLGAYYFDETSRNLPGRSNLIVNQGINVQDVRELDYNTRSYAVFGQATFSVTDIFRLTGGLRYTYEQKRNDQLLINYNLPSMSGSCNDPPFGIPGSFFDFTSPYPPQFCRIDLQINEEVKYNNVTWKVGAEYDIGPRSMAYMNIATGFKSGGYYTAPPPNTFRPEKLTSYELGIKNRFLDNRLQVNLEAFLWKYKDHQESFTGPTSIPSLFTFVTKNAGKATLYGADLDVMFRPTSNDELSFKLQYNKTKYDTFTFDWLTVVFGPPVTGCAVSPSQTDPLSSVVDCSGKSLIRAPLWSGTAGYSHSLELGGGGAITARFDLQFASATDLSIDFRPSGRQEAYAIGNLNLAYTSADNRFLVSAFVNNIWNEAVYNQVYRYTFISPANPVLNNPDGGFLGSLRPPRTFGGRVRVNF